MDRITAIHKSLTAFVCGILAFIPVLGLVAAVYSLVCFTHVRLRFGKQWNPAAAYLDLGVILALLSLLGSVLLIGGLVVRYAY